MDLKTSETKSVSYGVKNDMSRAEFINNSPANPRSQNTVTNYKQPISINLYSKDDVNRRSIDVGMHREVVDDDSSTLMPVVHVIQKEHYNLTQGVGQILAVNKDTDMEIDHSIRDREETKEILGSDFKNVHLHVSQNQRSNNEITDGMLETVHIHQNLGGLQDRNSVQTFDYKGSMGRHINDHSPINVYNKTM